MDFIRRAKPLYDIGRNLTIFCCRRFNVSMHTYFLLDGKIEDLNKECEEQWNGGKFRWKNVLSTDNNNNNNHDAKQNGNDEKVLYTHVVHGR